MIFQLGKVALIALVLQGCAKTGLIGSCRRTGDAEQGVTAACSEYSGTEPESGALKNSCQLTTNSVWSDGPCDTTGHCGYCNNDIPSGTQGKDFYFDTPGLTEPESTVQSSCLAGSSANSWIDNPDVTCI